MAHGISLLFVVSDCLAQLVGVPTVISCWNLLLQRNPNFACISSITRTFLYYDNDNIFNCKWAGGSGYSTCT
jgi:hypothetical protein